MSTLRRLRPLILPKDATKANPGDAPTPILLKTTQLRINDEYQRQLSKDSAQMAKKIAKEFDWELYHLLVVSPIEEVDETTGLPLYEVLDGQHTAIGAITNGNVRELWCWPGRVGESLQDRATSFEKLNTQRTGVTSVQLFWARVSGGSEDAADVLEACKRTGASIVKRPKPYGDMKVGETTCTRALLRLANKGGPPYPERVLKICMSLRLAPISQEWILTLEELLFKVGGANYIKGLPTTVDMQVENAIERIGMDVLESKTRLQHAKAIKDVRRSIPWLMAFYIKQEIERHAAS
jgi:hypothetical protein